MYAFKRRNRLIQSSESFVQKKHDDGDDDPKGVYSKLESGVDKRRAQIRSGIFDRQTHAFSTRSQGMKRRERKFSVKRRLWNND
jgi:hypothetical protein